MSFASSCKLLIAVIAWTTGMGLSLKVASAIDVTTGFQPERRFFMEGSLENCPKCETMTIIVSEKPLDKKVAESFRLIAERLGKKHAGVTISRNDAWRSFTVFKKYGCPKLDRFDQDFVVYIDRDERYCDSFPYQNVSQLREIVSIIVDQLGDAQQIGIERWVLFTSKAVQDYAHKYPLIAPLGNFFTEIVYYVGDYLKRN